MLDGIDLEVERRRSRCDHRPERLRQEHAAALHQRARDDSSEGGLHCRRPSRCAAMIDGHARAPARVGMIFQSFNLFPHLTVERNVTLGPHVVKKSVSREAAENARAKLLAASVWPESTPIRSNYRAVSSSAWRSPARLAMEPSRPACAMRSPRRSTPSWWARCSRSSKLADGGMTMMLVTHEMGFARQAGDRLVFMHAGRIHEMGPPAEVFGAPKTPELQQFLSALH